MPRVKMVDRLLNETKRHCSMKMNGWGDVKQERKGSVRKTCEEMCRRAGYSTLQETIKVSKG